jgi:hypothetical protein
MRILMTNNTLALRAGSEMYVHDVARQLKRLGHDPVAYSPHLGDVADAIRRAGIPVVGSLSQLPFRPDVIHGHHHVETMAALASLPGVPAVYFCHGTTPWEEMPPVFPRILRYVAVSSVCRERVVREAGEAEQRVCMIFNFADTDVFTPRAPLPACPVRALIYSNYATSSNFTTVVRDACAARGIELDVVGAGSGNATSQPEALLPRYDIVFAKGRAAIEALAVGCAVVLCDAAGVGPLVSTANIEDLRPMNFGIAALQHPHTVEIIHAAIRAYDSADAEAVRDLIRSRANAKAAAADIVRLYEEVIAENAIRIPDPVAELRAVGAYLQTLDTVIKHVPFGTPLLLPAEMAPDSVALP